MAKAKKVPVIQCDPDTYQKLCAHLQDSLVGMPVFYSDSLTDLVKRHCPDIYDMAQDEGFNFIPSDDKDELLHTPMEIYFDVVRVANPD